MRCAAVCLQDSQWGKTDRELKLCVMKKDKEQEEHWPRVRYAFSCPSPDSTILVVPQHIYET